MQQRHVVVGHHLAFNLQNALSYFKNATFMWHFLFQKSAVNLSKNVEGVTLFNLHLNVIKIIIQLENIA